MILDGSEGTARETKRRLQAAGLLRDGVDLPSDRVVFSFTAPGMEGLADSLLHMPPDH